MDKVHGQDPGSNPLHEERDTNIRAVLWFSAGLIATIVAVLWLMKWAFNAFPAPQSEAALSPYAQGVSTEIPPEPRLQVNAPEDLNRMREQEESVLTSYGWVDKQNGIVRIPIERAMELLARRGLQPRPGTASKPPGK